MILRFRLAHLAQCMHRSQLWFRASGFDGLGLAGCRVCNYRVLGRRSLGKGALSFGLWLMLKDLGLRADLQQ